MSKVHIKTACYHCGDECDDNSIITEGRTFCCNGCKNVYEILNKVQLCDYYTISDKPGISQKKKVREDKFAFLDNAEVKKKLIRFSDKTVSRVLFYLPQMHCSSCIWLLENLVRINPAVMQSQVNFLRKEVTVTFRHDLVTLRQVAELLTGIGYEPHISLKDFNEKEVRSYNRAAVYKIGVAGFCFGNIMLLSFPEYFSAAGTIEPSLKELFSWLILALSLPVFFYCAGEFFISAYKGLRQKFLNIDAPIALAVLITFARSVYEIASGSGAGYMDSMSGIVFFMLLGRFFQNRTFHTLTFNRDYTSYFPLGVSVLDDSGKVEQVPVSALKPGQRIRIYNDEIIPADAILFYGHGKVDYSFVSGESLPVDVQIGEIVYAGGRQTEGAIELEVIHEVSQSYLTGLWNNQEKQSEKKDEKPSFIHNLSTKFTVVLFSVAAAACVYWAIKDPSKIADALTSVLIVACPCALLLSATFTNGSMLRVLQRYGFYAKNSGVMERISEADTIIFDKTGTVTVQGKSEIVYQGRVLTAREMQWLRTLSMQSSHPLSKSIAAFLPVTKILPVKKFKEIKGSGIQVQIGNQQISLGSAAFVFGKRETEEDGTRVYVKLNSEIAGYFQVRTRYREGLSSLMRALSQKFALGLLSGDNEAERKKIERIFPADALILFDQSPSDKMQLIEELQSRNKKVIMVGDGLNDAGALNASFVGIAVTDNMNNFSPACDVVFEGRNFNLLSRLIGFCKKQKIIIAGSFIISIVYNIIGLFFAVRAELQPVIAAILMPLSSACIMLFTTGMSAFYSIGIKRKFHLFSKADNDSIAS